MEELQILDTLHIKVNNNTSKMKYYCFFVIILLGDFMKKLLDKFKNLFDKYPVTYISSILVGICFIIFCDKSDKLLDVILCFLVVFGLGTLLVESKFKNKIIGYVGSGVIGITFSVLSIFYKSYSFFSRTFLFYLILTISLSVYFSYKNSNKSFSKYLISVFSNVLEMSIIYFVLNIGSILILLILDSLLIDGLFDSWLEYIIMLLLTSFYIPSIIYSLDKYTEVNKFINILVTRVLFSLVLITYVIVYIYLFKIIITNNIPSNVIFRILSILFIISSIVLIMGRDNEKDKKLLKVYNYITYINIPLIILQVYSLLLRINNNGITIIRYLGIALILFEIIYTYIVIMKKDLGYLLFVIIGEMLFVLLIPFINCYDFSVNYQLNVLRDYKSNKVINSNVTGAYYYLIDLEEGNKVKSILSSNDIEKIAKDNYDESSSYSYYLDYNKNIDIKGYNFIKKNMINNTDDDSEIKAAIYNRLEECINDKNKCFENDNAIILDDSKIIIQEVSMDYNGSKIIYYYVEYYLLTK